MIAARLLLLLLLLARAPLSFAQEGTEAQPAAEQKDAKKPDAKKPDAKKEAPKPAPEKADKPKERYGSVQIGGTEITYAVQTGTLPVLKEDGSTRANVFYVYYAATGANGKRHSETEPGARPITYCFNGGPGASAVWLHLGGLSPRRIAMPPEGLSPVVSAAVVENPDSILDATDLVFIDPVSTGLSRAAQGEKAEQFFGVDEDIQSVGEFIRLFTTREQRWLSPRYLCGESYGVVRAAGLADYLGDTHGLYVHGLMLLSGLLNFQVLSADPGNDLPYLTSLPTFAATAHYHQKLAPEMQADYDRTISEARAFAFGDYAAALLRGNTLSLEERQRIAAKLATFTALDPALILDANLRIPPEVFRERLLRGEGKILGRFDGRVTGEDSDRLHSAPEFDPSFAHVVGAFSSAVNAYLRADLGYESDQPYRVLTPLPWRYTGFANRYLSMEDRLGSALKQNPKMKVLVGVGRRDLAVPPDAMRYSIDHLPIPPSLRANIRFSEYESGHMMYLFKPDAEKLRRDLVEFVSTSH